MRRNRFFRRVALVAVLACFVVGCNTGLPNHSGSYNTAAALKLPPDKVPTIFRMD